MAASNNGRSHGWGGGGRARREEEKKKNTSSPTDGIGVLEVIEEKNIKNNHCGGQTLKLPDTINKTV